MLGNKRGQSALEYGLLIAVVVGALLAVNLYLKRGVQGRLRESTDQVGRQFNPESYKTSWKTVSNGTTNTTENRTRTSVTTNTISSETITRGEHDEFGTVPAAHY